MSGTCFFFFSSRRRHTRFDCDWSSDVCSSDLVGSFGSFDNLWFVGSFDNTLVFFPLIIINLWFVCFFDDSIRVRLVTLLIYRTKMPIRSIMALLVSLMGTSSNWQTS